MHLVGGVAFYEADPGDTADSVLALLSTWTNYIVSELEILSPESPKYGFQDCPLAMVWHNGRVHLVVRRIIEESKAKTFCQQYPPMPHSTNKKEDLMVVQEIESTDLGRILEKVESAKALGLPFTLTAEIETKKRGQSVYRSLLYTLCIKTTPRGAVNLTVGGSLRVKEQ